MKRNAFIQIMYDHWMAIVPTFGIATFSYLKNKSVSIALYLVPVWLVAIALCFLLIIVWGFLYFKEYKQIPLTTQVKPKKLVQEYEDQVLFHVCWKVWLGYDDSFSDRRVWVGGPFCPKCKYELDHYLKNWFCIPCNKKFYIPRNMQEYLQEKIIKIFTAKAEQSDGLKPKK